MFKKCYWLGVGLMTIVAFGLTAPSAPAQVYSLPNAGGATWGASSAAMDSKNNIYAVGSGGTIATEFIAASLTGNGAVNTAFGGGVVTTQVGKYAEYTGPSVCAVQLSGTNSKLLSAGGYYSNARRYPGIYAAIVRYNANGALDTTFGAKGIVASTTFYGGISAMAVNPEDNTIVVGGSANGWGGGLPLGLARYNANGQLDSTFNKTGMVTFSPAGVQDNVATDVAALELQSDGHIVMAANLVYGSGAKLGVLMRFTSTGQLDGSFGSGGTATLPAASGGTGSVVYDIIVDENDNIITSGIPIGSSSPLMLTRFTSSGALDTTFGESSGTPGVNTGYITESFGTTPRALALDDGGNIVIAGYATPNTTNLFVARFTADGALDTSFGLPDPSDPTGQLRLGYNDSVAGYATRIHHSVQIESNGTIDVVANPAAGGNSVVLQYNADATNNPTGP
ncbi:MAG: hypothetical protein ABSG53_01705 [Thermoguttaceae bacterium]